MTAPPRNRLAGAAFLVSLGLLLNASALPNGGKDGARVLYPAAQSAHAGPVRLMVAAGKSATPPAVTLDGKQIMLMKMTFAETWELPGRLKATASRIGDRAACAIWSAEVKLSPGPHTLVVSGQKRRVFGMRAPKAAPPKGWTVGSAHQRLPAADAKLDCSSCHEMEGTVLGEVRTPQVCAPCHDETRVQLIHGHVPQPLAKCALCHDPHGASRPKLLVDAKEKLCARCHGSGHFR